MARLCVTTTRRTRTRTTMTMAASPFVALAFSLAAASPTSPYSFPLSSSSALPSSPEPEPFKTVTRLTDPLPLRPGEVTNTFHRLPIPPGPIAIYGFEADVVELDPTDGTTIIPTPLRDAYLHHHVVFSDHEAHKSQKRHWFPMKPHPHDGGSVNRGVGFGAGTESRGTPQRFYRPYAFTTVEGEDELVANVHVINTRGMSMADAGHCLECPCTLRDLHETDANGTFADAVSSSIIRSRRDSWDRCNAQLLAEANDACSPETYRGGLSCCEDGEFCLDSYDPLVLASRSSLSAPAADGGEWADAHPVSTFYLRYTLTYGPVTEETRPLYLAACCDASGNMTTTGNIEYDVSKLCDEKWDPLRDGNGGENNDGDNDNGGKCIHELRTVQMLHGSAEYPFGPPTDDDSDGDGIKEKQNEENGRFVDVVYMVGHLHRGGIDIVASDGETGEVLCKSTPTYGNGEPDGAGNVHDVIGNERGYVNSMSACTFDPPKRMKTTHPIVITSKYDARAAHTGVMSLFYIALADPPMDGKETRGFWGMSSRVGQGVALETFVAVAIVAVLVVFGASKHVGNGRKRGDYELVPAAAAERKGGTNMA